MIQAFRISFLFTRTYLDVFNSDSKSTYPLKNRNGILGVFADLQDGINNNPWKYPWEGSFNENFFWCWTLQGSKNDFSAKNTPLTKSADIFLDHVAALFYQLNYELRFESASFEKPIEVRGLELYAYRHGLGLIINPSIPEEKSKEIVEVIDALHNGKGYTLDLMCDPLSPYKNKTLQEVANIIFSFIEKKYDLGTDNIIPGKDPFSIITIVSDGNQPNAQELSHEIFNKLHGNFDKKIPVRKIGQNASARVDMFASDRSRIIWSGLNIQEPFRVKSMLIMNHYHNNISKLSLQIESLGDLLLQCLLKGDYKITNLNLHVERAQIQLVKFYGGQPNTQNLTYSSKSAIAQINDNKYLQSINDVRKDIFHSEKLITKIEIKEP